MAPISPDNWLEELEPSIKAYVNAGILQPAQYDVRFEHPTDAAEIEMPLEKTIIHFSIDDLEEVAFGFGDNVVSAAYDEIAGTMQGNEVVAHRINFDVGIWTSAEAGGNTARLRARQRLARLFHGPTAKKAALAQVGIHVLSFTGGRFFIDYLNDQPIYRVGDMEMEALVYGRRVKDAQFFIDEHEQNQNLEIDGTPLI